MCIIPGFTPYNDFYFISCYYNAFIPILNKYGISEIHLFNQYLPRYFIDKDEFLAMEFYSPIPYADVAQFLGVDIMFCNPEPQACDGLIKNSIRTSRPVVVWLDAFYQPEIIDVFQKKHWLHSFLVYGYQGSEYLILEHDHSESLNYGYARIHEDILRQSMAGYREIFFQTAQYAPINIFRYNKNKDNQQDNMLVFYRQNMSVLEQNTEVISSYSQHFGVRCHTDATEIKALIHLMNAVINSKKIQVRCAQNAMQHVLSCDLQGFTDQTVKVRQYILKLQFISQPQKIDAGKILTWFDALLKVEQMVLQYAKQY
jgi:hypothetical protein